jgi:hypothetical protein
MGIQIIPGPGAQIGQAAGEIVTAIDKFMNPNKDLQFAVRNAAATNPELLTHLADMESQNPGVMSRLGLGPVADIISSVAPSVQGIQQQALKPGAAAEAVAGQQVKTGQANLTADVVKTVSKIMLADPSIRFDAALRLATGQTGAERTTEQAKAAVASPASQRQIEALQRAGKLPADMSQVNWKDKANEFLNGKLDGGEVTAYFGNPDTSKAFQEAIDAIKQERQLAASLAAAARRGDNSIDNFRTQKAFQEYQRSGGVGNLDVWQKFLFNPEDQQRAKQLMTGQVKPSTPEDQALLNIANVTKEQVDIDKISNITKINDQLNQQIKKVQTAQGDQEREVLINGLNQMLDQRAALGGMKVKASYNDRGFWLPGRVEYKTPDGKLIDEAVVNAVIADPMGSDIMRATILNDRAKNALTMITNYSGDKAAALSKYKMQDQSPNKEDSKAVEQELIKAGLLGGKTTRLGGNTGEAAKP